MSAPQHLNVQNGEKCWIYALRPVENRLSYAPPPVRTVFLSAMKFIRAEPRSSMKTWSGWALDMR